MRRSSLVLVAVTLLAVVGTSFYSQGQPQNQPPRPARSRADETLAMWNSIGNKLIAMAQDFPEDKYDFKVQKFQRTFAQTLLHVAGVDYLLTSRRRPRSAIHYKAVLIWRANRAVAENFFGYSVANILGFSTNPDPAVVPLLKYIDDDSGFAVGLSI